MSLFFPLYDDSFYMKGLSWLIWAQIFFVKSRAYNLKRARFTEEEEGQSTRILGMHDWIVYLISLLITSKRLSSLIDNWKLSNRMQTNIIRSRESGHGQWPVELGSIRGAKEDNRQDISKFSYYILKEENWYSPPYLSKG